jgi:hypothetical protein
VWVYLPKAISPPSAEAAPLTLPSDECLDALAASSTWRTKPLPSSGWRRVWKKDASIRRLCGPTLQRSQAANSEAVSIWLSDLSPVRICLLPASEEVSTLLGPASSSTSWTWFARWDRATSSWRTAQASLMDGLSTPFTASWPRAGLMLSGEVSLRETLVRLMAAIGGGVSRGTRHSWPTPCAHEDGKSPEAHMAMKQRMPGGPRSTITSLAVKVQNWPTPRVAATRSSRKSMVENQQWSAPSIEQVAELSMGILPREFNSPDELQGASRQNWATPRSSGRNAYRGGDRSDEPLIHGQAQEITERLWATPSASPWRSGEASDETFFGNSRPLNEQAARWRSPNASDGHYRLQGSSQQSKSLPAQSIGFQSTHQAGAEKTSDGEPSSTSTPSSRPRLNPSFEEWLMWGPEMIGWTCVCAPGTTASDSSATPSTPEPPSGPCASSGTERSE